MGLEWETPVLPRLACLSPKTDNRLVPPRSFRVGVCFSHKVARLSGLSE